MTDTFFAISYTPLLLPLLSLLGLGSPASLYARSRGTALPSLAGEFTAGGAAGW